MLVIQSMPLRHYAITPLRHYAITPLRHYAIKISVSTQRYKKKMDTTYLSNIFWLGKFFECWFSEIRKSGGMVRIQCLKKQT